MLLQLLELDSFLPINRSSLPWVGSLAELALSCGPVGLASSDSSAICIVYRFGALCVILAASPSSPFITLLGSACGLFLLSRNLCISIYQCVSIQCSKYFCQGIVSFINGAMLSIRKYVPF